MKIDANKVINIQVTNSEAFKLEIIMQNYLSHSDNEGSKAIYGFAEHFEKSMQDIQKEKV